MQLTFDLDWRVITFTALVSLATTVLCGLLPAWRASRTDGLVAFKGEIVVGAPRRRPLGLVAQVVMSFVLLLVAGTFVQALVRMQTADPGFAVNGRLYAYSFIPTPGITACHQSADLLTRHRRTEGAPGHSQRDDLVRAAAHADRVRVRRPRQWTAHSNHDRQRRSRLLQDDEDRRGGGAGVRCIGQSRQRDRGDRERTPGQRVLAEQLPDRRARDDRVQQRRDARHGDRRCAKLVDPLAWRESATTSLLPVRAGIHRRPHRDSRRDEHAAWRAGRTGPSHASGTRTGNSCLHRAASE